MTSPNEDKSGPRLLQSFLACCVASDVVTFLDGAADRAEQRLFVMHDNKDTMCNVKAGKLWLKVACMPFPV